MDRRYRTSSRMDCRAQLWIVKMDWHRKFSILGSSARCRQGSKERDTAMNDAVEAKPKRWRKYARMSVRGLIIAVLVLGAWLGWIAQGAGCSVMRWLRSGTGGHVTYEHEHSVSGETPLPKWVVDYAGIDYFHGVFKMSLHGDATDTIMDSIGNLADLEELDLSASSVTDKGLAHLGGLRRLTLLDLAQTKITGEGLRHLADLTQLTNLGLEHTAVDDTGLAFLERFERLTELHLQGTPVTDKGAKSIRRLRALEMLFIQDTTIGDEGLKELQGMPQLRMVYADDSRVTEAGLAYLKALPRIENVSAQQTKMMDTGALKMKPGVPKLGGRSPGQPLSTYP